MQRPVTTGPFAIRERLQDLSRLEFYLFVMKFVGGRDCAVIRVCGDFRWMDGARIKQKSVLVECWVVAGLGETANLTREENRAVLGVKV